MGGISMKRRLALLLTVILTAAAVPSAQLMAADTGTEMTEMTQEDTSEAGTTVVETEISDEDSASEEAEVIDTDPAEVEESGQDAADAEETIVPGDEEEAAPAEEIEEEAGETDSAAEDITVEEAAEAVTEQELPVLEASELAIKVPTAEKALKVWAAGRLTLNGSLQEGGQVTWSASPAENVDLDPETGHYVLLKEGTVTFTASIAIPAAAEAAAEEGQQEAEPVTKTAEITVSPAGTWTLVDGVTRYYRKGAASADDFYKGWHETSKNCWTYFDVNTGRQNPKDSKTVKGDFWAYTPVSLDSNSGKSATVSGSTVKVVGDVSGTTITFRKGTYYFDSKGMAVIQKVYPTSNKNGFYYLNDNFIYVNTSGVVASGWTMINKNIRYFDPKTHKIVYGDANGWKAGLPAGTVYDGDTGKAVKDPYSSGNMKIPADKETLLLTPKKKSDGSLNTGILTRNCWKTVNNCKFWFKDNGRRAMGWWKMGKKTYYITKKTGCYKGIKQIDGKYYGFRDSGVMYQSGWTKIKDKYYYFKPTNGEMVRNASAQGIPMNKNGNPVDGNLAVDMLKKAQGYSSDTKHLILCDRAHHKLAIYEGRKGNWKQVKFWICSVGKYVNGKSVTRAGVHYTTGYYVYRRGKVSISYYCTYISSGNFIHSQQYKNDSMKPLHVSDGRMGVHITASCIRVDISRAKWVYNNIKRYTTVVVYGGK